MKSWICSWVLAMSLVAGVWAGVLEARADALMVPEINFRDTSLTAVVEYLRQATAKETSGAGGFNLVELYPKEFGEETLVTISLNNVPFSAVLKYVAESAGVEVDYQDHAIVLKQAVVVKTQ